jgi:hypothetical protein
MKRPINAENPTTMTKGTAIKLEIAGL